MSIDRARIKAICFDVDGTLSDTDDQWVEKLAALLSPLRFAFPKRDVRPFARWVIMAAETPGNLLYTFLDWAHLDDDLGRLFNTIARRRESRKPKHYAAIPSVVDALHVLHERYPMAVISARDRAGTLGFLESCGISDLFTCVATSQTCEYTKPFPHPVRWAAERMGCLPEEVVMVGDTTVDIRAGKSAGAQTVGVLCGFGTKGELRRSGADLILPTTSDLVGVLLK
jgi:HAD superfamily hydrolase (TIGR01509 family)